MIPVSDQVFEGNEKKYLIDVINRGQVSQGYYVERFENEFAKWCGKNYAVAVNSGTAALETALWACGVKRKVIMPSSTIISCPIAARRVGATPVFCDIGWDKPVMDIDSLVECTCFDLDSILRVHLFGHFSHIPQEITKPIWDIHDCSQLWDNTVDFGKDSILVYSLYANKMITAGEGGIIATNSEIVRDRARAYRNLCHSEERFIHWAEGYNFRMSELQGAVALAQLERIGWFIEKKQKVRDWYKSYLPSSVEFLADVNVPWMFLISTELPAKDVCNALKVAGIDTRRFFCPMHEQPMILGDIPATLTNSEHAWNHWLYLPSGSATLTESQVEDICLILKNTVNSMTLSMRRNHTSEKQDLF